MNEENTKQKEMSEEWLKKENKARLGEIEEQLNILIDDTSNPLIGMKCQEMKKDVSMLSSLIEKNNDKLDENVVFFGVLGISTVELDGEEYKSLFGRAVYSDSHERLGNLKVKESNLDEKIECYQWYKVRVKELIADIDKKVAMETDSIENLNS